MKKLLSALLFFAIASCTKTNVLPTPQVLPTNANAKYFVMGSTSVYQSADSAYNLRSTSRPYYMTVGIIASGYGLYNSQSTTTPFVNNGGYLSLSIDGSWKTVQIDKLGNIINIIN